MGTLSLFKESSTPFTHSEHIRSHYDVIAAPSPPPSTSSWQTNPFTLTGINGYLYGRGVTDNKGPILASACAVATLAARGELDVDVVFLIEGEEEAGSGGFGESVAKYKDQIGEIDAILVRFVTGIQRAEL